MRRYLAAQKARGTSKSYHNTNRLYITELGEAYNPNSFLDLTADQLNEFFAGLSDRLKPVSLKSVKTRLTTFFRFLNDGETPRAMKGVLVGRVPRSYRVKTKSELLTEEELRRIWTASSLSKEVIFRLLYYTGARPSEVLRLTRNDLVFRVVDGVEILELEFRKTKTGQPRTVPLIDQESIQRVKDFLKIAPDNGWLFPAPKKRGERTSYRTLWRYLKRKGKQVGINKKLYPYLIRHTRATELYEEPPAIRDRLLGWNSPMQWQSYTHLVTEDLTKHLLKKAKIEQDPEKRLIETLRKLMKRDPDVRADLIDMMEIWEE